MPWTMPWTMPWRRPRRTVCRAAQPRPDGTDRPAAPQPQAAPGAGAEPLIRSTREEAEAGADRMNGMVRAMLLEESPPGERQPHMPARTRRVTAKAAGTQGHRTSPDAHRAGPRNRRTERQNRLT